MMQSEFENLLGRSVDYEEYEKIETVYMCFEKMSKQEIADLYKRDNELVTTILYNHALNIDKGRVKKNAIIDGLRKDLRNTSEVVESMVADNDSLQKENDLLKEMTVKFQIEDYKNGNRIEELETELHQYRTLFNTVFTEIDIKSVSNLFKTLLCVSK